MTENLNKKNIRDILPLTPVQEGFLYHYLGNRDAKSYVEQLTLEIEGELDPLLVEKAWNTVIANNDALRTCFRWEKLDRPVQVILNRHRLTLRYMELDGRGWKNDGDDGEEGFLSIKSRDRREGFSLEDVPFRVMLFRLDLCRYRMLISNHHILFDGWSSGLILEEFFCYYNAYIAGREPVRIKRPAFKSYIRWLQARGPLERGREKNFWKEYFQGLERVRLPGLSIKKRGEAASRKAGDFSTCCVNLPGQGSGVLTRERLKVFVSGLQITPAALFYVAWGLMLQRYNRSSEVVFGTVVSGRDIPVAGIEDIVGLLVNTLAFRFNADGGETVVKLLSRFARSLRDMEPYAHTSLVDVLDYCGGSGNRELFDTLMVVENYPLAPRSFQFGSRHPFAVTAGSLDETTHYDLTAGVLLFADSAPVLTVTYRTGLYNEACIRHLIDHYIFLLEDMVKNPWKAVTALEMLSPDEKRKILVEFNRTDAFFPSKTIHGLFHDRAERCADVTALVWHEKSREQSFVTYEHLARRVKKFAYRLTEKGLGPGHIAAVRMVPSADMMIIILAVLETGAAYLPVDPGAPERRFRYVSADSNAYIVLTGLEDLDGPAGNAGADTTRGFFSPNGRMGEEPAYIIYTSGTTGPPKGVIVEHRCAVNLLWSMQKIYPVEPGDAFLFKTPYFFDVSVAELFGWFMGDGRLGIPAPGADKEPADLLRSIMNTNITHINFVPSLFSVFVDYLYDFPGAVSALRSLRNIFLAGEELSPVTVRRFCQLPLTRPIRLINLYGPTETTVYASWYNLSRWDCQGPVPIGTPLPNVRLYILDRSGGVQPLGIAGELGISGEGLAAGYMNRPEMTASKFVKLEKSRWYHPDSEAIKWSSFQLTLKTNSSHFTLYKSGDLARWRSSGVIEFLGRIDRQVKLRGYRIEPGEIEYEASTHPLVREAVVICRNGGSGGGKLCLYVSVISGVVDVEPGEVEDELTGYLEQRLPGYMVPANIICLESWPLTGGGKIDRTALPDPGESKPGRYPPPRTVMETNLASIWNDILFPEGAPPGTKFGIDDHFFRLGGHSLKAIGLTGRIHKVLGIRLTLADVFQHPTVRLMAGMLEMMENREYAPLEPAEERDFYPLSLEQQRMFLWQKTENGGTAYNVPAVLRLEGAGQGEKGKLERVFTELIRRYECLRSSFDIIGTEPVHTIYPAHLSRCVLEYFEVGNPLRPGEDLELEVESVISSFVRPFDLSRGPLLRAGYIHRWDRGDPVVMVDIHHIAVDGHSLWILARDFINLYNGETLPPQVLQYKDFVIWEQGEAQCRRVRLQEAYWLLQFKDGVPVLDLPVDFPRPTVRRYDGRVIHFEIPREPAGRSRHLAVKENTSLFLVLLSVYFVLLYKLTGQEDIVVGTAVAGRGHCDLDEVPGLFFHTVALRNYPSGELTFTEFLEAVKQNFLAAYENQDYPLDRLVQELVDRGLTRKDAGRSPLFSTMFSWQNFDILELVTETVTFVPVPFEHQTAKFDLFPMARDMGECIEIRLEYASSLFKPSTVEKIIRWFTEVFDQVVENPSIRLGDVRFTTHLIDAGSRTRADEYTVFNF